jgi:two-component system response regulator AtoC
MIKRIVLFGEEDTVLHGLTGKRLESGNHLGSDGNLMLDPSADNKSFNLKEVSKKAAEVAEKEIIQNTLQETHWNRKRAAKLLHVSYKALLYKIQKYRLDDRRGYPTIEEEAG